MNNSGIAKLKIERDEKGGFWIIELPDQKTDTHPKAAKDALQIIGEMTTTLDDLHFIDMELKKDIYIAFIGCLGRWVTRWLDPFLDVFMWSNEIKENIADVSNQKRKIYLGSYQVLETIQDVLFILDDDTFRKSLGSKYKSLSDKEIEDLKSLLYELASAVLETKSLNCATNRDE